MAPCDSTYLDSTRVCLDRESWSSSNADSEGIKPGDGLTQGHSHPHDAKDNANDGTGLHPTQFAAADPAQFKQPLSSQSERARSARLSRRKLTQEMQDLLAEQRLQESAAAQNSRGQHDRYNHRRLSSQDVRQGLHLCQTPASRPSSSNSSERTPLPAMSRSAHHIPPGEAWTSRSYTRAPDELAKGSRYDYLDNAVRPQTANLSRRQRALQTEPYSFPTLRDGGIDRPYLHPQPSDESLHWLVGAEAARSIEHRTWNDSSRPHSHRQSHEPHREPAHNRSYPTHAAALLPFQEPYHSGTSSLDFLPDQLLRSRRQSLAARSLQTQPFSLDAHNASLLDPTFPQPASQPPPLHVSNPVSRRGSRTEDLSSQMDMRLLSFEKKPIPGLPLDQDSVKSQYSNPRSYRSSYDYKILAGKEPNSGASTLRKDYEADTEEEGGPKAVSRPSSKSASSTQARARQYPRLKSLQRVRLLVSQHC